MKLADIKANEEKEKEDRRLHAISAIVDNYKEGHIHYALAIKQLVHQKLTTYQAELKLK